jgi:signal transduction histidine kinase/CheY-like chemotaxis protein
MTETFKVLFDRSPVATLVVDGSGTILHANRAATELHGDTLSSLAIGLASGGELADVTTTLRAVGRALREVRILDTSGAPACELLLEGYSVDEGRYAIILRDVTERRAVEAELAHLRRVESLGFVTASVVHDFNNMLTPVVCLSSLLAAELERGSRAAGLANEIRTTSERAAGLVRQMLSFVRREASRTRRTNVANVVTEMGELLGRVMGSDVALSLALDESAGETIIDREQLEQVLLNLAANARDAMPSGGKLLVSTAAVTLSENEALACDCPNGGSFIALSVSDTGLGMTPEVRERIFERFFTTKPGRGSGLGLATAHKFARASAGCIMVRSAPNVGTTVTIFLPRAEGDAAISSPPSISKLPRGREKVLVVEDDAGVRGVVRALLEESGYQVAVAESGRTAVELAACAPDPFDLVIADVVMPGMHGRAVVDALQAAGKAKRWLFMSGHGDGAIRDRGVLDSSDELLRKAFSPAELLIKVREVLDAPRP